MAGFCRNALMMLGVLVTLLPCAEAQNSYDLLSPDKRIDVKVRLGERVQYSVLLNGIPLLENCTASITIDHNTLGAQPKLKSAKPRSYDGMLEPVVRQKFAKVRENYNELRLEMQGNYAVVFRAYNEGVAYRLETSLPAGRGEGLRRRSGHSISPATTPSSIPRRRASFRTTNENIFRASWRRSLPTRSPRCPRWWSAGGVKVAIAESDRRRLSRPLAAGHQRQRAAAAIPALSSERNSRQGSRLQSDRKPPTTSPSPRARAPIPGELWASPKKMAT